MKAKWILGACIMLAFQSSKLFSSQEVIDQNIVQAEAQATQAQAPIASPSQEVQGAIQTPLQSLQPLPSLPSPVQQGGADSFTMQNVSTTAYEQTNNGTQPILQENTMVASPAEEGQQLLETQANQANDDLTPEQYAALAAAGTVALAAPVAALGAAFHYEKKEEERKEKEANGVLSPATSEQQLLVQANEKPAPVVEGALVPQQAFYTQPSQQFTPPPSSSAEQATTTPEPQRFSAVQNPMRYAANVASNILQRPSTSGTTPPPADQRTNVSSGNGRNPVVPARK